MGWLLTAFLMLALIALMVYICELPKGSESATSEEAAVLPPEPTLTDNSIKKVTGFPSPQGSAHGPASPSLSTPAPGIMLPSGGVVGGIRRNWAGWREWRRADPTLINSLWRSKMGNGIRKQLGNAEVYIMLALLIGLVTVIIGCWLSDNCWSPEPDHVVTVA